MSKTLIKSVPKAKAGLFGKRKQDKYNFRSDIVGNRYLLLLSEIELPITSIELGIVKLYIDKHSKIGFEMGRIPVFVEYMETYIGKAQAETVYNKIKSLSISQRIALLEKAGL